MILSLYNYLNYAVMYLPHPILTTKGPIFELRMGSRIRLLKGYEGPYLRVEDGVQDSVAKGPTGGVKQLQDPDST